MTVKGNYGLTGNSGIISKLDDYDPDKITHRYVGSCVGTRAIMTPFSGRSGSIERWSESVGDISDETFLLIWDNSNSAEFHSLLLAAVSEKTDRFCIVTDLNPSVIHESWQVRGQRCSAIYDAAFKLLSNLLTVEHIIVIEDDIKATASTVSRLEQVFGKSGVDCIVGDVKRREGSRESMIYRMPFTTQPDGQVTVEMQPMPTRQSGVELIGGAHMGLWISKADCVNRLWQHRVAANIIGADLHWGVALRMNGRSMAVDWSAKAEHIEA